MPESSASSEAPSSFEPVRLPIDGYTAWRLKKISSRRNLPRVTLAVPITRRRNMRLDSVQSLRFIQVPSYGHRVASRGRLVTRRTSEMRNSNSSATEPNQPIPKFTDVALFARHLSRISHRSAERVRTLHRVTSHTKIRGRVAAAEFDIVSRSGDSAERACLLLCRTPFRHLTIRPPRTPSLRYFLSTPTGRRW